MGRPTTAVHATRLGVAAVLVGLLLGWLAAHADLLFADGLRYVAQAKAIERGSLRDTLTHAADHPAYPAAIALARRFGRADSPAGWESAARLASIVAAVLLILPFYCITRELFGDSSALPACLLFFGVPVTGHVFADTTSESTFLLFWAWGLFGALKFLRHGGLGWLAVSVAFSGAAYLTRPEGLLLPAALGATLILCPRWTLGGVTGRRGGLAVVMLTVGSVAVIGPFVALKGGLATKPSVARLLGKVPKSDAHAVERQRPLDTGQTQTKTYLLAVKAVVKAVTDAVTPPLLVASAVGFFWLRPRGSEGRQWTLLSVIAAASVFALVRLHATGGYCAPRHALILAMILLAAAGAGLSRTAASLDLRWPGRGVGKLIGAAAAVCLAAWLGPLSLAPVNEGLVGYKQAGRWLADHASEPGRVVDVTGWSQFYGGREGYTFENLVAAADDPRARWVVVRESHLTGPWSYCTRLKSLVYGLKPVLVFSGANGSRPTRVLLFDRAALLASSNAGTRVR